MKQLSITINGKGGVGKSLFTTHFLAYLEDRGIPAVAFDTDNENSTLRRFCPEAGFLDVEDKHDMDQIFESLETNNLVVVDARAASTDIFLTYFKELKIFEYLSAVNARLTLISPINHEADSIEQVRVLVEEIGGRANYVVVKNRSHSEHFEIWDESKTAKKIQELGGMEIIMPKIYDWICTSLQERNLTVSKAIRAEGFRPLDTQRLKNWQEELYGELEKARDLLLPSQTRSASQAIASRRTDPEARERAGENRRAARVANVSQL